MKPSKIDVLKSMAEELSRHKRDRKDLRVKYVNDRLTKSLMAYYSGLVNDYNYAIQKNSMRVLKKFGCDENEK